MMAIGVLGVNILKKRFLFSLYFFIKIPILFLFFDSRNSYFLRPTCNMTPCEGLLTGTSNAALHAEQTLTGGKTVECTSGPDSEEDLQSEAHSPVDGNFQYGSPDKNVNRDESGDQ